MTIASPAPEPATQIWRSGAVKAGVPVAVPSCGLLSLRTQSVLLLICANRVGIWILWVRVPNSALSWEIETADTALTRPVLVSSAPSKPAVPSAMSTACRKTVGALIAP